jgi:hypothetical protein
VLLDIGSVFGGIGLAVVGFVVVILVCVVILRLLASILPSYEDRTPPESIGEANDPAATPEGDPDATPVGSSQGEEQTTAAQETDTPA